MVRAGAVDHLRGRIPGFRGGGLTSATGLRGLGLAIPAFYRDFGHQLIATMKAQMKSAMHAAASAAASSGFMDTGARSGNAAIAQQYAASLLSSYGWGRTQFGPLLALWNQESGWNAYATNASSGAYGIPQSLGHGHPYNLGDYKAQIIWGLNYIRGRYGSPAAAWGHEVANNWYSRGGKVMDNGGWIGPGSTMVRNNTGRAEHLVPTTGRHGGDVHIHGDLNVREQADAYLIARSLAFQLDA
jgi:hypothetical protein